MAVAIRGTPATVGASGTGAFSVTLNGARQPQAGDVLLIIHCNDFYLLSNMATPTVGGSTVGVTAVTNGAADGGSNQAHTKSYTYVVGSAGDLVVSETETGTADEEKALVVYVLSGVDIAIPVDIAGNATGASSVNHVAPTISPAAGNSMLFCHVNSGGSGGTSAPYTPPGGMAETYDINVISFLGASGANLQLAASGATGTKTFTAGVAQSFAALSIAMKSASSTDQNQANPFVPWRRWYRQRGMFLSTYDLLTDRASASAYLGVANVSVIAGVTASGGTSGAASVSPSVAITATGTVVLSGAAAAGVTASLTAAGSARGPAAIAETVSVTAAGNMAASGTTSVAETVTVTAAGSAAGSASVSSTVAITAAGLLTSVGSAAVTETVGVTTAGSAAGSVSVTETVGITATGGTAGSATRAVTASVTVTGSATETANVAPTVTVTASGGLVVGPNGTASRDVTVTVTAAGNLAATSTATVAETVSRTAAGSTSATVSRTVSVAITATGTLAFTGTVSRVSTVDITATGVVFVPPPVSFFEGAVTGGVRVGPGATGGVRVGPTAAGHVLLGTVDFYLDIYDDLYVGGEGTIPAGVNGAVKTGAGVSGGQLAGTSVMGGSR